MSSNEIETNDVNGSRLAEQGPSSGRFSRQGNIGRHANPVISKRCCKHLMMQLCYQLIGDQSLNTQHLLYQQCNKLYIC